MIYLNIGLKTNNGTEDLRVNEVLYELARYNIAVLHHEVQQSSTEQTLVCKVNLDYMRYPFSTITSEQVFTELANILHQDCIAIYSKITNKGFLIGEHAAKWGEFNLDYFLFPKGEVSMKEGYQGHSADGSSIQNHSIGGLYPLILFYREGQSKHWGILHPDSKELFFDTCSDAQTYAINFKGAK